MDINRAFKFNSSRESYSGTYPEPSTCPLCKHAIKPQEIHLATYQNEDNEWFITGLYLCKHCYQTFITLCSCTLDTTKAYHHEYHADLIYSGPTRHENRDFPDKFKEVTPKFVEIYNQAKAAEDYGLNEICGIGYRKALEFLIKDYLVYKEPDKADIIRSMELGKCIANKITDEDIKAVASRCAWLGNDQTHYTRRFEEYDLETLKQLLDATIYWVSMKFATEFATSIERRR